MLKTFCSIVLVISFVVSLWGCNTMSGFGKDVKKAGEKIEKAAD
jgi:predicted small secreted protein